ncbi:PP2C family serine/threonine-protein phosphatase [Umezakia ovalisporum]|jgi:serine/threonine protein phosphatase PrpC|uniref:Protein phosphatase 2C domain-containing protein n=2 Tax=Umezakia ovalisporum TaxID=75695 RepID=A0AA43KG28_9CYAN|nr:PP2C family serine/threonine-protein phosphatase [Umezakia ovalisporum]MBI1241381.1 protein phosphatase 2C domain-containing protein [Nostoc sp. RI_552]MDH6057185.1 protein phosphatase 2C domain-containing protein [Umezakia ovalisporum FSS-43]MDH6064633.1 protein phosphatase 2C domain-containing protein [Umezakia ovalisporum FSS-62]MDH6069035.1 protein phosphatase 2C domain-containing protein [Umezakia ovalisporum APH033B]MDH6071725.1 protein phosphatase 2C domain-containing protein [Umezak
MNTKSKQIFHWRVVAASVCGTSHLRNKQLCQDAHHWQLLPDNVLLIAAADGAGSASQGKMGAMVAVETAIETLSHSDITRDCLADDAIVESLLNQSLVAAKKAVEDEAVACNKQPQDLATTLIIVITTPDMAAVVQIGDGLAVAKDHMGNLLALTTPDNGEYINETTFLTSPNALDRAQMKLWRETIVNIGVLTDGLQMLALNMVIGEPHKPFFFPLFDFVENAEDKTLAKEQLVRFLGSERITQRTDDDLTLILAGFPSADLSGEST